MDAPPFSAVNFAPWQSLVRRLDAAVTADQSLAGPRDVLTRPVELLLLLSADTPAALGDDVLVADRLRALFYLTLPFASVVDQADRVLRPTNGATTVESWPPAALPPIRPYQPGVIDMGALPLLAVGAARVGPDEMAPIFMRVLHGLALAASAAEVLGRLDPEMPDERAMDVIVHTLHLLESLGSALRTPYLRTFVFDPVERGRWQCLAHLFDPDLLGTLLAGAAWDGAHTREIRRVVPRRVRTADPVVLLGRFDFIANGAIPDGVQVVFASPGGSVLPARVVQVSTGAGGVESEDAITVEAPAPGPGWVGFSIDEDIAASNAFRAELRARIAGIYADDDCLASTRVADDLIPPLLRPDPRRPGQLLSMPPRGPFNRLVGGEPLLTSIRLAPEVVGPADPLLLTWESTGADHVERLPGATILPPAGTLALTAPDGEGRFSVRLQPVALIDGKRVAGGEASATTAVVAPVRIRSMSLRQDGRSAPFWPGRPLQIDLLLDPPTSPVGARLRLDPACGDGAPIEPTRAPVAVARGPLRFDVPGPCVVDGLTLTAELVDPQGAVVDRRVEGPLVLTRRRGATVVLFRPFVLAGRTQLDAATARARIAETGASRGLTASIVELPWADDQLAVVAEPIRRSDDPAMPGLLGALAHRALVTPGLEHALWLALLPDEANVAGWAPSAATWAVAVAAGDGLGRVLDGAFPPGIDPPIPPGAAGDDDGDDEVDARPTFLRLFASARGAEIGANEVARDRRQPGRGGTVASRWIAVELDREGGELARHPIHLVHAQLPGYLEALLPVNEDVAILELRHGQRVGLHVARPAGVLTLAGARLVREPRPELIWQAEHSSGLNPRITLAVDTGGVVTPVAELDRCGGRDLVWLDRLGPIDRLVLQASDGWTRLDLSIEGDVPAHELLALRRLRDGRWFAQAPDGWTLTWSLAGRTLAERGPLLALPAGATGLLAVEARGPEGESRIDARRVDEERA